MGEISLVCQEIAVIIIELYGEVPWTSHFLYK